MSAGGGLPTGAPAAGGGTPNGDDAEAALPGVAAGFDQSDGGPNGEALVSPCVAAGFFQPSGAPKTDMATFTTAGSETLNLTALSGKWLRIG